MAAVPVVVSILALGFCLCAGTAATAAPPSRRPVVEAEEVVYSAAGADNGAGPMWSFGSSCLARVGADVFISGLELVPEAKPLNNVRWRLFQRRTTGWQVVATAISRTREPCPLITYQHDSLFLSDNPTLAPPEAATGPARPEILRFSASDPRMPMETLLPTWQGTPEFTEHSYRSLAADPSAKEMILFQNTGYTHAEWSFRDASGKWSHQGQLAWPWGAEYPKPQPVRTCYPSVALKDRKVYFCGVSDIIEPYPQWREYKQQLTGQEWDYDFRRLFFTWSDDITTGKFHDWIEISSRDSTCGWIFPNDLWVDAKGVVHLLWSERALDERLREKFYPEAKQSNALMYARVEHGKVTLKRPLLISEEGKPGDSPDRGRFHITPDGSLFVLYSVSGRRDDRAFRENRLMEIRPDGTQSDSITIALTRPFSSFYTASWRNGSPLSDLIDVYGETYGGGDAYSYASIRLVK
jgi:hypothetical protein